MSSAPFQVVVRTTAKTAHGALMSKGGENVFLSLPDVGALVRSVLQTLNPEAAAKIPRDLSPRLAELGQSKTYRMVQRGTTAELARAGVTFLLRTRVVSIERAADGRFAVRSAAGESHFARWVLAAPGRWGSRWFRETARALGAATRWGAIDIGCRVEVAGPVYDEITRVLYDPKFLFVTPTHGDRTRTFCTNPGGRVRSEMRYGCRLVNGDALKRRKTGCTNFAILNTVSMTEPLQDTAEMARRVMEFANFWGGGDSLVVQRWGDLVNGKSSKRETGSSPPDSGNG